jgi:hypothetical protein
MNRRQFLARLVCGSVAGATVSSLRADDLAVDYRGPVDKGLSWLAGQQARDGHWEANNGQYPMAMTGLAGLAFLMQGSTLRDGKYFDHLRRAVDWLGKRAQPSGLLARTENPFEAQRYIHGHGYATLFLACAYGEEEDGDRRKRLEEVLTKAVEFSGKAQSSRGGWYYTSAADCGDMDEGSTTITQLQALRACRNAGIVVPKSIIDKAMKYLKDSTTPRNSIIYSLSMGPREGTPALVAAALAGSFSSGEYRSDLARRWLGFCQANIPLDGPGFPHHEEYTHYYYAQALYALGEDGYAKLFPDSRPEERLTWSKYRTAKFPQIIRAQQEDGSWNTHSFNLGPVYASSMYLSILQLDLGTLPFYQR